MDQRKQTSVTDSNRSAFYQTLYPQQHWDKSMLVQLNNYDAKEYILVDCCGWHYKEFWPDLNIVSLETITSAKKFKLGPAQVDGLINDLHSHILWPSLVTEKCVLIFDYSPILKYQSIDQVNSILSSAAKKYNPGMIVVNVDACLIDSSRLVDRFYDLSTLKLPNYIVSNFAYDSRKLKVVFRRQIICE